MFRWGKVALNMLICTVVSSSQDASAFKIHMQVSRSSMFRDSFYIFPLPLSWCILPCRKKQARTLMRAMAKLIFFKKIWIGRVQLQRMESSLEKIGLKYYILAQKRLYISVSLTILCKLPSVHKVIVITSTIMFHLSRGNRVTGWAAGGHVSFFFRPCLNTCFIKRHEEMSVLYIPTNCWPLLILQRQTLIPTIVISPTSSSNLVVEVTIKWGTHRCQRLNVDRAPIKGCLLSVKSNSSATKTSGIPRYRNWIQPTNRRQTILFQSLPASAGCGCWPFPLWPIRWCVNCPKRLVLSFSCSATFVFTTCVGEGDRKSCIHMHMDCPKMISVMHDGYM